MLKTRGARSRKCGFDIVKSDLLELKKVTEKGSRKGKKNGEASKSIAESR